MALIESSGEGGKPFEGADKAMRFPVGMASPLWLFYAGATGMGVAYWLMTRWTKPVNLEALMGRKAAAALAPVTEAVAVVVETAEEVVVEAVQEVEAAVEVAVEAVEEVVDASEDAASAVLEPLAAEAAEPAPLVLEPEPEPEPAAELQAADPPPTAAEPEADVEAQLPLEALGEPPQVLTRPARTPRRKTTSGASRRRAE